MNELNWKKVGIRAHQNLSFRLIIQIELEDWPMTKIEKIDFFLTLIKTINRQENNFVQF